MCPSSDSPPAIRVLFVEDNEDARAPMVELMEMCGYVVIAVGSAELALEQMHQSRFDALLTDISLPGMSGVALSRAAKAIDPALRVIAASGYGAADAADGAFDVVLTKPYAFDALEVALNRKA